MRRVLSNNFAICLVLCVTGSFPAFAGDTLTVEELIGKLQDRAPTDSRHKTRDLGIEDIENGTQDRLEVEPGANGGREVHVVPPSELPKYAERHNLPAADIEVYFDFNSDVVTPAAILDLQTLGKALTDGRLAGGKFIIAGHTDAKGGADYNQHLSQRRAAAVRGYLVTNFAIDPKNIIAIGYGKQDLKAPQDPFAAINRRVQIINVTGVALR